MSFTRRALLLIPLLISLSSLNSYAQTGSFNLEDWPQTQPSLKPIYVKAIMEQAGIHRVTFSKSAEFYAAELDKFSAFAREKNYLPYLKTSVAQNLATIAVVNCDWNNGVPHWEFAQKYLGDAQIELLKPLYGEALIKLKNNCIDPAT
jgi:hypothetical protein